jgi:hypothetical protein
VKILLALLALVAAFISDNAVSQTEEFAAFQRGEIVKWNKVIKDAGAKID